MTSEIELPRISGIQGLLVPKTPRELCREIGLNWWAAVQLFKDGWLSFDPEGVGKLDDGQEAELRFVGAFIANDCPPLVIEDLLSGLRKPFCYRHSDIYYDWSSREWKAIPKVQDAEDAFNELVDRLKDEEDVAGLRDLQ